MQPLLFNLLTKSDFLNVLNKYVKIYIFVCIMLTVLFFLLLLQYGLF